MRVKKENANHELRGERKVVRRHQKRKKRKEARALAPTLYWRKISERVGGRNRPRLSQNQKRKKDFPTLPGGGSWGDIPVKTGKRRTAGAIGEKEEGRCRNAPGKMRQGQKKERGPPQRGKKEGRMKRIRKRNPLPN